jgi:hypothetical protein
VNGTYTWQYLRSKICSKAKEGKVTNNNSMQNASHIILFICQQLSAELSGTAQKKDVSHGFKDPRHLR